MQIAGVTPFYDLQSAYGERPEVQNTQGNVAPIDRESQSRSPSGRSGDSVSITTGKEVKSSKTDKSAGPKRELSELSPEDMQRISELQGRDREVRAHEAAHVAAGGQYVTGGPSFEYQTGPDGKRYAVGGEVGIDTSPVKGDPQATISKMEVVKRAALAPGDPSAQDRAVAASAAQKEMTARAELASQNVAKAKTGGKIEGSVKPGKDGEEHSTHSKESHRKSVTGNSRSNPYATPKYGKTSSYASYA